MQVLACRFASNRSMAQRRFIASEAKDKISAVWFLRRKGVLQLFSSLSVEEGQLKDYAARICMNALL